MQAGDHLLELGEGEVRHRRVAPGGGEERDGVVAPIVHEVLFLQVIVLHEGVNRQQFHRRDAEALDVVEHLRRAEAGIGAAQLLRHLRVELGEALHMGLVDDGPLPRHVRLLVAAPGEGGVDHPRAAGIRGGIAVIEGGVVAGFHLVAEQGRVPRDGADETLGVGVDEELVRVEPVPGGGLVGAVDAEAVDRAGAGVGQVAVPDLVRVFGQFDPLDLALALVVEQAQFDLGGVGREHGEVHPQPVPGGTERIGQTLQDARAGRTGLKRRTRGIGHGVSGARPATSRRGQCGNVPDTAKLPPIRRKFGAGPI